MGKVNFVKEVICAGIIGDRELLNTIIASDTANMSQSETETARENIKLEIAKARKKK